MRDLHASQIKAAVEAVKARKEVNEVYFVACGGSQAVLMAGQYMFDKESSIPSHAVSYTHLMTVAGLSAMGVDFPTHKIAVISPHEGEDADRCV